MKKIVEFSSLWIFFNLIMTLCFFACTHLAKLDPEVSGNGAKAVKNGVIYLVPEQNPILKVKLVSLGLRKEPILHLRMYFIRKNSEGKAYLDPKEQSIELPDSQTPIFANKIHASTRAKPVVQLLDADKRGIEFLFPLPSGGHDYRFIKFHWKIHYTRDGKQSLIEKIEKYSAVDNYNQHSADDYSADGDFPYEEPWLIPDAWAKGWLEPDMLWW